MRTSEQEGIIEVNAEKLGLLFALQESPTASAVALAKKIKKTPPTARAWLDALSKEQVYGGVQASLRVRRIGMEMDDFLLDVDSYDAVKKIERFCDEHPYTSYRARIFGGSTQGIVLQFRQPDQARTHLIDALNVMKKQGIVKGIRELPTLRAEYGSTYTRPRLEAWDPQRLVWNFNWDEWWDKAPKKPETILPAKDDRGVITLDELDVKLLEELTKNARRKNTEIIDAMGLEKDTMGVQQLVSQKIKRLEEEVIESYRVFINWTYFDVYNTPFVIAKADESSTDRLIYHLATSDFPFGSTIRKTEDGFVWSARLPSAHLSEMIALVWQISKKYEVLMFDYKHSELYGLWADTFDKTKNEWRTDRAFCFDAPMKSFELV